MKATITSLSSAALALLASVLVTLLSLPPCTGHAQETVYTPKGGVRPYDGRAEIAGVRLLAAQDMYEQNIGVQKLADFVKETQQCVEKILPADAPGFGLLIKVTLSVTGKPQYEMSSDGKANNELLQTIYDQLEKQPDVRTKTDVLAFEIRFKIKPKV